MDIPALYQVLYISKSKSLFDKKQLNQLLEISQARNRSNGITGYLYYEKGFFLQYIEAHNKNTVDTLLHKLLQDERHTILNWLVKDSKRIRRFSDWSMRCIRPQQLKALGLEGTILDCMECLSNKKDLSFSKDYKVWFAMDAIAKQKKYFDTQI